MGKNGIVSNNFPVPRPWSEQFRSHQPLVPVLPVARELLSKTKWIASRGAAQIDAQTPSKAPKLLRAKGEGVEKPPPTGSARPPNSHSWWKKSAHSGEALPSHLMHPSAGDDTADGGPESHSPKPRSRMFNVLHQKSTSHSRARTPMSSESSTVRNTLLIPDNCLNPPLVYPVFRHRHPSSPDRSRKRA